MLRVHVERRDPRRVVSVVHVLLLVVCGPYACSVFVSHDGDWVSVVLYTLYAQRAALFPEGFEDVFPHGVLISLGCLKYVVVPDILCSDAGAIRCGGDLLRGRGASSGGYFGVCR